MVITRECIHFRLNATASKPRSENRQNPIALLGDHEHGFHPAFAFGANGLAFAGFRIVGYFGYRFVAFRFRCISRGQAFRRRFMVTVRPIAIKGSMFCSPRARTPAALN